MIRAWRVASREVSLPFWLSLRGGLFLFQRAVSSLLRTVLGGLTLFRRHRDLAEERSRIGGRQGMKM